MTRLLTTLLLFLFVGASGAFAQGSLTEDENGNVAKVHEQQKNEDKPWQFEAMIGTGVVHTQHGDSDTFLQPEGVIYAKGQAHIIGLGVQHQNWGDNRADVTWVYGDWWWANCIEGAYLHVQPGVRSFNHDDLDVATEYGIWAELYVPVMKDFELSGFYKGRYTDFSDEVVAVAPVGLEPDNIMSHEVGGSVGAFVGAEWYLHGQFSAVFSEDAVSGDNDVDFKPQVTVRRYLTDDAANWVQLRAGVSDYSANEGVFATPDSDELTNNYFVLGTLRMIHSDHVGTQFTGGYVDDQDYGERLYGNVSLLFFF